MSRSTPRPSRARSGRCSTTSPGRYDLLNSLMTRRAASSLARAGRALGAGGTGRLGARRLLRHRRLRLRPAPGGGRRRDAWWAWTSPRRCWPSPARSAAGTSSGWISCRATCWTCPSPTGSSTPARWVSASATCPTSPGPSARWAGCAGRAGAWCAWRSPSPGIIGFKQFYNVWFDRVVPWLGRLAARRQLRLQLPARLRPPFPGPGHPAVTIMRDVGLVNPRYEILAGGHHRHPPRFGVSRTRPPVVRARCRC